MDRRHLFEIIDRPWCPGVIREGVTDYLRFLTTSGAVFRRALPLLARAMERAGATKVVDLGSGAGGPWSALAGALEGELGRPVKVTLTDLHPLSPSASWTEASSGGRVRVYPEPVDVLRGVPGELEGFRTLISLLHHFPPDQARRILGDALRAGEGVAVFEVTRRTPAALALMLMTPLNAWLVTPWIRPFRWSRLLLTYAVPLIPLVATFDGVVSCLRTYTPAELLTLTEGPEQGGAGLRWEAGVVSAFPPSPIPVTYLIGTPSGRRCLD